MPADGYSVEERLDFDFSVRALKRWADHRAAMTRQTAAPPAPKNPQMTVPLYASLAEVLDLPTESEAEMARLGLNQSDVDDAARALLNEMGRDPGEDD